MRRGRLGSLEVSLRRGRLGRLASLEVTDITLFAYVCIIIRISIITKIKHGTNLRDCRNQAYGDEALHYLLHYSHIYLLADRCVQVVLNLSADEGCHLAAGHKHPRLRPHRTLRPIRVDLAARAAAVISRADCGNDR